VVPKQPQIGFETTQINSPNQPAKSAPQIGPLKQPVKAHNNQKNGLKQPKTAQKWLLKDSQAAPKLL
jgi:hypothetical protein